MSAAEQMSQRPELAISARGLRASYAGHEVLSNVDIHVAKGEVLCLIGHNGAGKSTLLKMLFGLHRPDAGDIAINGIPIAPDPQTMTRMGVAYVPEGRGIFPSLTVKEIFSLGLWSSRLTNTEKDNRIEDVITLLPRLKDFWTKRAGQLSGGQQQMVSIGRALLSKPSTLLLDEPSIGLAPKLFQDLMAPIREAQQRDNLTILLVEQKIGEAFAISDRVIVMKSGSIIHESTPDQMSDRAKLVELF